MLDPQSEEFQGLVEDAVRIFHLNYRRPVDPDDDPERFREAMFSVVVHLLLNDPSDITGILEQAASNMAKNLVKYPGTPYTKDGTESLTNTLRAIGVSMELDQKREWMKKEDQPLPAQTVEEHEQKIAVIKKALDDYKRYGDRAGNPVAYQRYVDAMTALNSL